MDPLSITTSVITLLGAASNIYNALQAIRNADRGFQSLVKEVSTLNGYLRSIDKALENCRDNAYALSHIDPALWKESKIALSDCQQTIDELGSIFKEPKRPSRSNTLFRRARVAAEMRSRAGEIASFREKISMSNLSLQTLLQVINVSLSLRSNESQDNILRDLKELKAALKKSSQAATVSYSTLFLNEQDIRLVHHLKGLIRAAHEFHTSASVTASTVAGSTQPPPTEFGDDDTRSGISPRLPSVKRMQIETYLSQNQQVARSITSVSSVSSISGMEEDEILPSGPPKGSEVLAEIRETDSNHTFSTIFTGGFSKIAQRALQQLDLEKAEGLLREALKWYSSSGSNDVQHQLRLQTQLALCTLLQGNIQEAQDLILALVDSSAEKDTVAHQLLYALALLQLHELDFEGARENSKRLWAALQGTPHCTVPEANDAMRVIATSYQESGDSLLADAIEAELPELRLFEPVPKMVDFLVDCKELLIGIFGLQDCPEISRSLSVVRKIHDLPIAKNLSSLQMREQALEDVSSPISTCPSIDADDELSVKADPDFEEPKVKKRSWSNLRALFRPRLTDLYPLNTGAHDSSFKIKKIVKVSRIAQMSAKEPDSDPNASVSSVQSPIKSKQNSLTKVGSEVQKNHDLAGNSRTMEWVAEQADSNPTNITKSQEDILEQKQQLQRQFSFQEGVPDHLFKKPLTVTPTGCYEMPDNAIFELMDTSPSVKQSTGANESCDHGRNNNKSKPKQLYKIPKLDQFDFGNSPASYLSDKSLRIPDLNFHKDLLQQADEYQVGLALTTPTSLEMENDIYNLLGYDRQANAVTKQSPAEPNRKPSSVSSDPPGYLDSTSGSESDISSVFDEVKQSTRQTSFDSSFISVGVDSDSDIGESSPARSLMVTKRQRATELRTSIESPTQLSPKATSEQTSRPEQQPLGPLQAGTSSCEATKDTTEKHNLKSHARSRREFGPAVARLCRYKSPRKTVFRRRLPVSAAAGICRLFRPQNHGDKDNFDFGFNKALYTGPDAVVGPFTDLGEADSHSTDEFDTVTSSEGLSDTDMPVKLHSRAKESVGEASVDEKRKPSADDAAPSSSDNHDRLGSRKSSLTRVQIDEFFKVSQEHCPFRTS
ncbi:hypothetical protein F5Y12DRAFT_789118 [Xylaria sp. FL1777]|nr:hypothetical protein F5Y12DRAFT_789118 [Xylaria sp. FL1777]